MSAKTEVVDGVEWVRSTEAHKLIPQGRHSSVRLLEALGYIEGVRMSRAIYYRLDQLNRVAEHIREGLRNRKQKLRAIN